MRKGTFSTRTSIFVFIALLVMTIVIPTAMVAEMVGPGTVINLADLIITPEPKSTVIPQATPLPEMTTSGGVIKLTDLIVVPEIKPSTRPPQQSSGMASLSGWSVAQPKHLEAKEVRLSTTQNGREYFYVYHKHEKRALPNISLAVGESIVIKVTMPDLSGVGAMTRNAPDSDSLGRVALKQVASPAVGRGSSLALGSGGWNGQSVEWRITATADTGGKSTMATLTLVCNTATGAGPDGGSEAKYMPKVLVKVLPRSGNVKTDQFQKRDTSYLFIPSRPTNEMVVWLAGGGERGDEALNYGLPKLVKQFGSNRIVLVPTKQTSSWNTSSVSSSINETLDYLAKNGYRIERVYGEGFSAGAHGIAEVAAAQQLHIPFTEIRLFGGNTNGETTQLLQLLSSGHINSLSFFVGESDSRFVSQVKSDYKKLSQSGKVSLHIVPNVGHRVDLLYAYANQNTP